MKCCVYLDYGVRPTGYKPRSGAAFVQISEMVPELIVPDLTGFKVKKKHTFLTSVFKNFSNVRILFYSYFLMFHTVQKMSNSHH
jgi:hypothetical protein